MTVDLFTDFTNRKANRYLDGAHRIVSAISTNEKLGGSADMRLLTIICIL